MKMPFLNVPKNKTKKYIVNFRGLNYSDGYKDGEFAACENLSSERYPCITPRRQRAEVGVYSAPTTLHAKEGLLVIDGTKVLYEGKQVGTVTAGRKQIATIGNYVVIFPDKVYYNVAEDTFQSMEASYSAAGLKFTDSTITTTGADWPFRVGDAVEISGCSIAANNKTPIVRGVDGKVLTFYENTLEEGTESGTVTIKRNVPDLDFICESNYRLWGTKGNTIYGSKYGDPLNFFCYDGLTGDSYYIDVGTDGEFTGCIPYSSHICFFKENALHKLYGTKPSNFQVITADVYGLQAGSERSLCTVNDRLLYKGVHGIYCYAGGIPELISENFGTRRYSDAAAACDGERYYISMKEGDSWHLYVYDVLKGIWLEEDNTKAIDMAFYDGSVYMLCADGTLQQIDRNGIREDVEWSVTFCPFNETMVERKGYSRFSMRIDMTAGSWLSVDMKTDQDQKWREVYTTHNERARTVCVPIRPTRCDSVSIRVRGQGDCTIQTFVREFTVQSHV